MSAGANRPGDGAAADARSGVTVVVPAYNAERFVGQTVAAALAQEGVETHVVVVDDGSTDGTAAAARAAGDAGRVTVVRTTNGGPARARNLGWEARPAPFVAFLDADDLWDAGKLAAQLRYLDAHPEAVGVGCFMRYLSAAGEVLGRTGTDPGADGRARIARGELMPFPLSSLVVRGEAHAAVGGFDACFRQAGSEDLDYVARLAAHGAVGCVPATLGAYRIHSASAMARHRSRINAEARFVRQRIAARAAGGELTWAEFAATHAPSWRERWQDRVEMLYRGAALSYGERRRARGAVRLALAALLGPRYTLRRLYRQRRGGAA